MKKRFLLLSILILTFICNLSHAQIFVNDDATGDNDGSSWPNAYNDLQDALAAAVEGDTIWVAEGIYKPDTIGGSDESTFLIDQNLKLYGGFVGTENSLAERGDPADHPTILSGDLNSNDMVDDFVNFKEDNVMTVVTVASGLNNLPVVDGFIIQNGHADGTGDEFSPARSGGGIYTQISSLQISQCLFKQNYAATGGGAFGGAVSLSETDLLFTGCLFENNTANYGGAISIYNADFLIENCTFDGNIAFDGPFQADGGGLKINDSRGTVQACLFKGNQAHDFNAGLRVSRGTGGTSSLLEILDCTFDDNHCNIGDGGGLGISVGTNSSNASFLVDGCTFLNNETARYGGGTWVFDRGIQTEFTFKDCTFNGNTSNNNGGAMWINTIGEGLNVSIRSCDFNSNESGAGGGAMALTMAETSNQISYEIKNCFFENNHATINGGAVATQFAGIDGELKLTNNQFLQNVVDISCGGGVDLYSPLINTLVTGTAIIDSCYFEGNMSPFNGALNVNTHRKAELGFTITNSIFENNQATEGGAMGMYCDYEEPNTISLIVDKCLFDGNEGIVRGGAMELNPQCENFSAFISNTQIINNESPVGGAFDAYLYTTGIAISDSARIHFENCLIANNSSDNFGISLEETGIFSMINCTVAGNQSKGIGVSGGTTISLQNTILHNNGTTEFEALTSDVNVTSNGGNLIGDSSLVDYALPYDQQNTNPLLDADYYPIAPSSPAIDKGIDLGNLPATDLDGNNRLNGCVDIGAYESNVIVSTECIISTDEAAIIELVLTPNPASDFLNLQLPESITQPTDISLFDAQGRLVEQRAFLSGQVVQVSHLPSGFYTVKITDGDHVYIGRFVKE